MLKIKQHNFSSWFFKLKFTKQQLEMVWLY